ASTDTLAKNLTNRVTTIQNAMKSGSGEPAPVDQSILGKVEYPTLASHQTNYFIDIQLDNTKRGSPQIVAPTEFQVDLVRAPILVYMFSPDMEKIYVVVGKEKNSNL